MSKRLLPLTLDNSHRYAPAGCEGMDPADITVSCTGFFNSGPDCKIVRALSLVPSVQRYHLGFTGCYAAFPALFADGAAAVVTARELSGNAAMISLDHLDSPDARERGIQRMELRRPRL